MKKLALVVTALCLAVVAQVKGQTQEVFAYSEGDKTLLHWNVFLPNSSVHPPPWPVALVIHGGGFKGGNPGASFVAQDLAAVGIASVTTEYRTDRQLLPGQTQPAYAPPAAPFEQVSDVKKAVLAARSPAAGSLLAGRVTGKVVAVGGSAGGSHAGWCAATGTVGGDRLDAAATLSGAHDFDDATSLAQGNFAGNVELYCQTSPAQPKYHALLQAGSPINQVQLDVSPLFVVASMNDPQPAPQYQLLVEKLNSFPVTRHLHDLVPGGAHAFGNWEVVGSYGVTVHQEVTDWLLQLLAN